MKDGEESAFQLNVFSPFLLSYLLLPAVQKSNSGRMIIEASSAHSVARRPDLTDMKSAKKYEAQGNYSLSKLYAIWMARHFIKYLKENNITNVTFEFLAQESRQACIHACPKHAIHFKGERNIGIRTSGLGIHAGRPHPA